MGAALFSHKDHTFAVCAYGESPFLEACLQSLRDQTQASNCIISTSTPNDFIEHLAVKYDLELYVNEGKPSISHDWNSAIEHCTTPLVTIAHQDDVYLPRYTEVMLAMVNADNHPLIFFSDYGELRESSICDNNKLLKMKRRLLKPLSNPSNFSRYIAKRRALYLGSAICCPSVTFCLDNLPNPVFLDNMKCDLDWEAWERFSRLEGSFVYAPEILMRHRIHEGSETTALIRDDTRTQEDFIMLQKFWPTPVARLINIAYSKSQNSNAL